MDLIFGIAWYYGGRETVRFVQRIQLSLCLYMGIIELFQLVMGEATVQREDA